MTATRASAAALRLRSDASACPMRQKPLTKLLADAEPDVRQMAAFALGLIGDPAARPALQTALGDANPLVQGRAAEALGHDRQSR